MLHAIRERATGWLAYLIILLISIPFALWGISEYLGFGGGGEIAEVNGEPIPSDLFNQLYQQNRQDRTPAPGQSVEEMEADMRQQILDGMITRSVLRQYLIDERLDVSDATVMKSIQAMDLFQGVAGEGFDMTRYRQILQANRMSPEAFEEDQRQSLRMEMIQTLMESSAIVTEAEAIEYQALREQTRSFRYFAIPRERFLEPEAITEEEIEAEYQMTLENYVTAERARVSYLELKIEQLDADMEPLDEAIIQQYFEAHAIEFMAPELRQVRQIFFKDAEAETVAQDVYERLQEGEEFAEVAKEQSQDSVSRELGGDIGWLAQDDLPEDLGIIVFGLTPGVVSSPVKTTQGVYLLEVVAVEEAKLRALEEVHDQVAAQARRAELERRYAQMAEELSQATYENPEQLATAAEQLGLEIQESGHLELEALPAGVLSLPEVAAALRRGDVLQDSMNSDRIDLADGWSVVVRADDYETAETRPLQEVRDEVRDDLARQAAQSALLDHASALTERLNGERDLEALAAEEEAELITREAVQRTHAETPQPILERVFSLSHPKSESVSFGMAVLDDRIAVIALDGVQSAEIEQAESQHLEVLRYGVLADETQALHESLEARASIVRYLTRLE